MCTPIWNPGTIPWPLPGGATNLVQVSFAGPTGEYLSFWRAELPDEDLAAACRQFAAQFPFPAYCMNVVAAVAQEWAPDGSAEIQEQRFGFTPEDVTVFI